MPTKRKNPDTSEQDKKKQKSNTCEEPATKKAKILGGHDVLQSRNSKSVEKLKSSPIKNSPTADLLADELTTDDVPTPCQAFQGFLQTLFNCPRQQKVIFCEYISNTNLSVFEFLLPPVWPTLKDFENDNQEVDDEDKFPSGIDQDMRDDVNEEVWLENKVEFGRATRYFLGYYLTTQFSGEGDDGKVETNYYRAAPKVIGKFLDYLKKQKAVPRNEDFKLGLKIAKKAKTDVPNCRILFTTLPGAHNWLCEQFYIQRKSIDSKTNRIAEAFQIEFPNIDSAQLRSLDENIDKKARVTGETVSQQMEVCGKYANKIEFKPYSETSQTDPRFWVEFESSLCKIFSLGMVVTGRFNKLSNGEWIMSEGGYVYPSFYSHEDSLDQGDIEDAAFA